MMNPLPAQGAPVPIRIDDRVTFVDDRMPGRVHSLHRELKNGRPGIRYRVPCGPDRMRWAYLSDVATVNGQRTDYAQRYPVPEEPHDCDLQSCVRGILPPLRQFAHNLAETKGLFVSVGRVPVPEVFDPEQEEDLANGLVGIDVQMRFRMYVLPGEENDASALQEAFERWLEREYLSNRQQAAPTPA
jgi:hypothetical protein